MRRSRGRGLPRMRRMGRLKSRMGIAEGRAEDGKGAVWEAVAGSPAGQGPVWLLSP